MAKKRATTKKRTTRQPDRESRDVMLHRARSRTVQALEQMLAGEAEDLTPRQALACEELKAGRERGAHRRRGIRGAIKITSRTWGLLPTSGMGLIA